MSALNINGIDLYYGDLQALWDVSMTVSEAEVVALIGSNGAGKSSLLKAIMGVLRPRKGAIAFNDLQLHTMPTDKIVEAGVCMIPEGRALFPRMSVLENLQMGAFVHRAREKREFTIEWVYEIFPVLRERKDQMAGSLSGGEQQMLAIAKGLMSRPKLILLDEMSSGLSPLLVKQIFQVVPEIQKQGISVLIVEQNIFMALKIADRGYVIENGRIVKENEAAALLKDSSIKEAYLGIA
jgi:branched-chain amino acid transport system ATP-binding protein